MPCDLQKLLASAAQLTAASVPREPSVGERILRDLVRMSDELDRQNRRDRAAALGYFGAEFSDRMLDTLELMQQAEEINAQLERYERLSRGLPVGPSLGATSLFGSFAAR